MMKGGCKDHIRPENRVFEEQKTIKQEAQNVVIAMLKGLPLSCIALLSSMSAEIVSLPAAARHTSYTMLITGPLRITLYIKKYFSVLS